MKLRYLVLVLVLILISGCISTFKPCTGFGCGMPCPIGRTDCLEIFTEIIESGDISRCEDVISGDPPSFGYEDRWIEKCREGIAYNKGEPELCEVISPFKGSPDEEHNSIKDRCYKNLAIKLNDISLCNNVETDWSRKWCPEMVKSYLEKSS